MENNDLGRKCDFYFRNLSNFTDIFDRFEVWIFSYITFLAKNTISILDFFLVLMDFLLSFWSVKVLVKWRYFTKKWFFFNSLTVYSIFFKLMEINESDRKYDIFLESFLFLLICLILELYIINVHQLCLFSMWVEFCVIVCVRMFCIG